MIPEILQSTAPCLLFSSFFYVLRPEHPGHLAQTIAGNWDKGRESPKWQRASLIGTQKREKAEAFQLFHCTVSSSYIYIYTYIVWHWFQQRKVLCGC